MSSPGAVVPERLGGVLDLDLESGGSGALLRGNVSGPETVGHGFAGLCEGGLGDRVALGPVLECDGIALGSGEVGRLEGERAVSDNDQVVGGHGGASNGGGSGDGGETHYDWFVKEETSSFK